MLEKLEAEAREGRNRGAPRPTSCRRTRYRPRRRIRRGRSRRLRQVPARSGLAPRKPPPLHGAPTTQCHCETAHQILLKRKAGRRSVETELVFPSEAQTRLNASNISRSLNLALEKAKMTDFHFHDLRHTCATRMVQAGVDLYKVQRLLGYKSPIMTQRYAHHCPESLGDGVEALDVGRVVSTNLAQLRVVSEGGPASC